ncbi:MAG TPA: hypothetical protein VJU61_15575 [Polyangiaceae bacterium]|nr:hypothetical protein [Polyangiaceae bacterium]
MQRSAWIGWMGGAVLGVLVGGAGTLAFSMPSANDGELRALPRPAAAIAGKHAAKRPQLQGKSRTVISDFAIDDLEGHEVLRVKEIAVGLELEALGSHVVEMPGGHARGVTLLLRRGKTGRVSLGEALGRRDAKGDNRGTALDIGPLQISDARMTVAVSERSVVFQIDRARIKVQKRLSDAAPRVFLSDIHGYMEDPDPLPQPVRIHGGKGVIDLAGHPLVDMRARACIGGDELRVHIEVPERQGQVRLRVDAEGFSARSARVALNLASKAKERLEVSSGAVEVTEPYDCTRAEGKEVRQRVKREERAADDSR